MNIYEDYQKYIEAYRPFIADLTKTASPILSTFEDIVAVCDYTLKLFLDHSKIDDDLAEAFEVGFQYLISVFADLKVYYDEYFSSNMDRMNYYAHLITYSLFLDDYKDYLIDEDLYDADISKIIDEIQYEIDNILVNGKPLKEELIDKFDLQLQEHISKADHFHPVPSIFNMMRELLDII